jgi:hypothetical protein
MVETKETVERIEYGTSPKGNIQLLNGKEEL